MKIGVFDSGVGGQRVADFIQKSRLADEVVYRNDRKNVPYGSRSMQEVKGFVVPILQSMVASGCQVIVVACNTVTTNLIDDLRRIISVPLIGMEPMVKPAAKITKSKVIVVCATPATLVSPRYAWLKSEYAADCQVVEPDCSDWAYLIEQNMMNQAKIAADITPALESGADVIVLGCTHYHWIETDIQKLCQGRAVVIQPEPAILHRLDTVVSQL